MSTSETPEPDNAAAQQGTSLDDDRAEIGGGNVGFDGNRPVAAVAGSGPWLHDTEGHRYFDAIHSAAASSLGYAPPSVVAAVGRQADQWIGLAPLAPHPLTMQLADQLAQRAMGGQAVLTASGSEAVEAAIRLARWLGRGQRYKLITFAGSYHGATLGSLTASGDPQLHQHVGPLAAGFTYCPYGDDQAVAAAIDDATAAILVQPLQTHDRMRLPPDGFLAALRRLADDNELLLVLDETQLPIGLSGDWFAYQRAQIQPDLLALSAGLAGGLGSGALVIRSPSLDDLPPTDAWPVRPDPLAAAAVLATLEAIEHGNLLSHAQQTAAVLVEGLNEMREDFDLIRGVDGLGLMIGIELDIDAPAVLAGCLAQGLLLGQAGDHTLRLQPPLVSTATDAQQILAILRHALEAVQRQPAET